MDNRHIQARFICTEYNVNILKRRYRNDYFKFDVVTD